MLIHAGIVAAVRTIVDDVRAGDIILIGGLARLGKSSIALAMEQQLTHSGFKARTVSIDRWIRSAGERHRAGVENRYELDGVSRSFRPWLLGQSDIKIALPIYDRMTRTRLDFAEDLTLLSDDVLILEGVPALLLELDTRRSIHRIYVEGDEQRRRDRVVSDLLVRGMSGPAAVATYEERVRDEVPPIAASRVRADHIIVSDQIFPAAETLIRSD